MPYKLIPPGKRGPCWYVRGTDSSGEFEFSTGKDARRDAERWVEEILLPARARRRVPGAGETIGFRDAARFYKAAHPQLSRQDIRKVDAIADEIGDVDCRSIVHATLVAAAETLHGGKANATKNRYVIAPAAAVLHYAAANRWCDYSRIEKYPESRQSNRQPATDATMAALFAHLEEPPRARPTGRKGDPNLPWKRLLLAILYELGLRLSDNLRIDWQHIDLERAEIAVHIRKTDRRATLRISPVLVSLLANLPRKHGRLFPWSTSRGVYGWLDRVQARAGVRYSPHLSRHALATAAGLARIPDGEAAKLGAWLDPRSLHRYQHVRPEPIAGRDAGFLIEPKKAGTG